MPNEAEVVEKLRNLKYDYPANSHDQCPTRFRRSVIRSKDAKRRSTLKTKRNSQRNGNSNLFANAKSGGAYGIVDLFCGTGGFSHGFASFNPRFRLLGAIDVEADPA